MTERNTTMNNDTEKNFIIDASTNALEDAKRGLAEGYKSFVIDRRGADTNGNAHAYKNVASDLMVLSFLCDMEANAHIITDNEMVYMITGIKKSYYDFLMECEGVKAPTEEDAPQLILPNIIGATFAIFSWDERSEGVSVSCAEPELTDAVLTNSYPAYTNFSFLDGNTDALISVRRGKLLIVVNLPAMAKQALS